MRIHIIIHESFESPAAIAIWAKQKQHQVSYTHLYRGEQLPANSKGFDFLIVMGGPQSPATTLADCPHFDAEKEISLIKNAIQADKLILGVCLGAQLIGEAFGAKYMHSPNKEIGVFPVRLTNEAQRDELFSEFPQQLEVGHWHGDMPGLTAEAKVLATSEGCPRQIVKYATGIYGFQCHFEFTLAAIEDMIAHCADELNQAASLPYIWDAEQLRSYNYNAMNQWLFSFLDSMQKIYEFKQ